MAYNKELLQNDLSMVTKELIQQAIFLCYKDGITSRAPLGYSGDTIVLHGETDGRRSSQVSIRNYCGDAELLIIDKHGNFLFYGRFAITIGADIVVEQYWNIFNLLKKYINSCTGSAPDFTKVIDNPNVEYTDGFQMLRDYLLATHQRRMN